MRKKMKGLALFLCLTLMLTACGGNTATTMRLEKKQGTVGVEDEKDKLLEPREGMQLYSGYEVGTALESLAWIGLDDTKAVKLDSGSTAEILQSGKKLTVKLYEGKLFFNVSQPLAEDETFTIETATMVTGIRGTSGWMEVLEDATRLVVLEGSVDAQSIDPETGETRTTTVTGGQALTVVYHGGSQGSGSENAVIQGMIGDNIIISDNIIHAEDGLRVEEYQGAKTPDFVRDEVSQSQQLQEKIEANSPLSVPEILEGEVTAEAPPEGAQMGPPEQASGDVVQELPEDAQIENTPNTPATPPASGTYSSVEEEVYYEPVTVEWYETVTTPGVTPPTGGGGTGTPSGSSGTQTKPADTEVYRPVIQVISSAIGPEYAVITPMVEKTTYDDSTGTVTSNTVVESLGMADEIVPIEADGTIKFTDHVKGGEITLPLS